MGKLSWLGIGLVLAGATMLLNRLDIIHAGWQPVVWGLIAAFGVRKSIDGFTKKKAASVFWGTFLFLFGVYNVLRDLDGIELRSYWMVPALLLIVGFSLVMMYVSTPRDWHLLVPAASLLGVGTVIILTEFGYFYRYDVIETIRTYWPMSLVVFGLALVLRRISPPSHP